MTPFWTPPGRATTYPRPSGSWTVAYDDGRYASFSPESLVTTVVDPRLDPKLPGLGSALDRGRLVAYRIGRRAVVATGHSFLKVVRPSKMPSVERAHRLTGALHPATGPAIIAGDPSGVLELAPLGGTSVHLAIRRGTLDLNGIDATVEALVRLHSAVSTEPFPTRDPDPAPRWIDTVARVDVAASEVLASLAAQLPEVVAGTGSLVHGDLHDKNIFVDGSDAGFIDLDGLAHGGAEHDLANLAVHLQLRAIQSRAGFEHLALMSERLYDAYGMARAFDRELAHNIEQHTWFRLGCLYLLRSRRRDVTVEILDRLDARAVAG